MQEKKEKKEKREKREKRLYEAKIKIKV